MLVRRAQRQQVVRAWNVSQMWVWPYVPSCFPVQRWQKENEKDSMITCLCEFGLNLQAGRDTLRVKKVTAEEHFSKHKSDLSLYLWEYEIAIAVLFARCEFQQWLGCFDDILTAFGTIYYLVFILSFPDLSSIIYPQQSYWLCVPLSIFRCDDNWKLIRHTYMQTHK